MKFPFGKKPSSSTDANATSAVGEAPSVAAPAKKPEKKSFALPSFSFKRKSKAEEISADDVVSEPARALEMSKEEALEVNTGNALKSPKVPKEPKQPTKSHEKDAKAAKVEKQAKGKKPSFARKPRFTLLIGDEGAILIHMKGSRVLSRQFVPDASESNLKELRQTIVKDDLAPITMIIDSMDQAFVQQTLPPVSSLSVQKLIRHRMERDFKADDIKGAIVLGKEKGGRRDWNFLMISVDKSPQITLWLDFIMSFNNRFRGIVLLSVETEIFISKLERAIGGAKLAKPAEWKFIVTHNKVGGFRQIVLRNGRLIFTRLAQPVGEPTPEVIAGNIEQEMTTTVEYLRRFGYDPRNGLEIYVIAADAVVKLLDVKRFEPTRTYLLSPYKVAQYFGIEGATQPTDQYGDVILAASIGGSRSNVLKLTTVESRQYDSIQKIKYGQRLLGTFIILGVIVYGAYLGYNTLILNSDIEDLEQKIRINQQATEQAKKRVAESKLDIEVVTDRLEMHKLVKEQKKSPLPTLTLIASAIKPPLVINSFSLKMGNHIPWPPDVTPIPLEASKNKEEPIQTIAEPVSVIVNVDFPAGLKNGAMFKKFSEVILEEMQAKLKGYMVLLSATPIEYLDADNLQVTFDKEAQAASKLGTTPVPMEIYIYGPFVTSIAGVEEP